MTNCTVRTRNLFSFFDVRKLFHHCKLSFHNSLGLCISAKALGVVPHLQDKSIESSFEILLQFGEELPCSMGDKPRTDIDKMNNILQSTPDDMILNMQENNDKKMTTLINLYATLAHVLQFKKPWLVGSVSLRMVELTMKTGLSAKSPLAFAHFGGVLVTAGRIDDGCRLGEKCAR
jgi:hypothetical protein